MVELIVSRRRQRRLCLSRTMCRHHGEREYFFARRRGDFLLRNLVTNAIKYGAPDAPVRVVLTGKEADVQFKDVNRGRAIEQSALDQMFDPLKRGPAHPRRWLSCTVEIIRGRKS